MIVVVGLRRRVLESQFWRRYWQTFSTGFSSGARDGSQIGGILSGMSSLPDVCQPALIEDQHGMGARSDVARDLIEMKLHRLGVGMRKRQRRADAAGGQKAPNR